MRRREVHLAFKPALEREQLGQSVALACKMQVHLMPPSNPLCINSLGTGLHLGDGKCGLAKALGLGDVVVNGYRDATGDGCAKLDRYEYRLGSLCKI